MFSIAARSYAARVLAFTTLVCMCWTSAFGHGQNNATALQFQRDIAPIFQQSCGQCHINSAMGKLRLDSESAVLRGGVSGPAIAPGHSADSLLVKRLLGLTD